MQKRINLKKLALILILTLIVLISLLYISAFFIFILNRSDVSLDLDVVDFTDQTNCGVIHDWKETRNKRIVNGQSAIIDSFPWVVSLRLILNATSLTLSGHICGGCLVSVTI